MIDVYRYHSVRDKVNYSIYYLIAVSDYCDEHKSKEDEIAEIKKEMAHYKERSMDAGE